MSEVKHEWRYVYVPDATSEAVKGDYRYRVRSTGRVIEFDNGEKREELCFEWLNEFLPDGPKWQTAYSRVDVLSSAIAALAAERDRLRKALEAIADTSTDHKASAEARDALAGEK